MCRVIKAAEPRRLHAVAIEIAASSLAEFLKRRKAFHNVIGYQRRRSAWWRSVGLWLWWRGSRLRGIVDLGSVTAEEFGTAFEGHGPVFIRPIDAASLRVEVYNAALGLDGLSAGAGVGRYQPFKIAIAPAIGVTKGVSIAQSVIQPMPMLL